MLSSITCRFSAKSENKCDNYGQWLSLDRFSPHVEMFYAEISRLTSNTPGRPSLLGSPLLLCTFRSLTVHAQSVDNAVSVDHAPPSSTLHDVLFLSFFFMFEHLNSLFLRPCSRLFWTSSAISTSSPLQSTYPTGGWSRRPCRVLLQAGFRVLVSSSVSQL